MAGERRPERFWWVWLIPPVCAFTFNIASWANGDEPYKVGVAGAVIGLVLAAGVIPIPLFMAGRWFERWRKFASTAGWRSDPTSRAQFRYRDGSGWTELVSTNGERGYDPI